MAFRVVEINNRAVQRIFVKHYPDGSIYVHYRNSVRPSIYRARNIAYDEENFSASPYSQLDVCASGTYAKYNNVYIAPNSQDKLWFSPNCKLQRDLFRASGYLVTRDKENAKCLVIPKPEVSEPYRYNAIVLGEDVITFVSILKLGSDDTIREKDMTDLQSYLKRTYYGKCKEIIMPKDGGISMSIYFVQKYDEYKDILTSKTRLKGYIYETDVPLQAQFIVSPENLHLWMNLDSDMLEKTIMQSDAKKYPFTVTQFLKNDQRHFGYYSCSPRFRVFLTELNYNERNALGAMMQSEISVDDWNMLQRWQLYKLGLPEEGGMVDKKTWMASRGVEAVTRQRLLVKPEYITEPVILENMLTYLKNRN